MLDLPIAAGGEIVFVGLHLLLGDPELAGELVDLRLHWGHPGLEFSEFGLGFLAGSTGLVSRTRDDLLKLEAVDDGVMFEAVGLERGNLLFQVGQALGAFLLELRIPPVIPAVQHIGDVVLGDLLALVVQ